MNRIAESELIINSRGAVYHLDVRPEELADTIITVGDPDRVGEVSKHFDSVETKRNHREFVTHTGYIGKKRVSVVSTGIGTDNIDIVVNELDALVNIDFESRTVKSKLTQLTIVRVGTSGALQADVPVDSFVASTHGIGIDNLLNFYRQENNEEELQLVSAFVTHTQMGSKYATPYIASAGPLCTETFCGWLPSWRYHHLPWVLWPAGKGIAPGAHQPRPYRPAYQFPLWQPPDHQFRNGNQRHLRIG
jgi:uridine phosphorylase